VIFKGIFYFQLNNFTVEADGENIIISKQTGWFTCDKRVFSYELSSDLVEIAYNDAAEPPYTIAKKRVNGETKYLTFNNNKDDLGGCGNGGPYSLTGFLLKVGGVMFLGSLLYYGYKKSKLRIF
jgi:hypothetical protein